MMKKLILVTLAAALLFGANMVVKAFNPLNMGIEPLALASEQEPVGKRLEISFSYDRLALIASNQYAIWIEDLDGNYIDTLYVTRYTSQEGHRRRPNSIPQWVSAAKPGDMSASEIDAVSGATPKPGNYVIDWDFTDRNGNMVPDSQYRYFFEASLYNDDLAVYSSIINTDGEPWTDEPAPEYSNPDSEYKAMISNVKVAYYPD